MANINTKRKRKEKVEGYGAKRGKPVHTERHKKKPWLDGKPNGGRKLS